MSSPVITFEPTISFGTIVQIVVFIGTVAIAYAKFVTRMTKLEMKVNLMWTVFGRKLGIPPDPEPDTTFFSDQ